MPEKYVDILGLKVEVDDKQLKEMDKAMGNVIAKANSLAKQFNKMGMDEKTAADSGLALAEAMSKVAAFNKRNSLILNEETKLRKQLVSLEKFKEMNARNLTTVEKQRLNENISGTKALIDATLEKRKAELDYLKEVSDKEKELQRQKEEASEKENALRERRDNLRQNGLISIGKMFSASAINKSFDKTFNRNDRRINANNDEIDEIDKKLNAGGLSEGEKHSLKTRKSDLESQNEGLKSINAKNAVIQGTFNTAIAAIKKVGKIATTIFSVMGIDLKNIMSDVVNEIKNMLSKEGIASYSTGSSIFTNSKAREQQMKYGLSNSSNYALTQTMGMLNMSSDDDLMYMNETQKEYFNSLMDKYQSWYDQLEASGALQNIQEAQMEFSMFKQELSYKLLNWFAEHRDTIFTILEFTMEVLEFIANVVEKILSIIPGGSKKHFTSSIASDASDTSSTNNYSTSNKNVNTNASFNITVNNSQEGVDTLQTQLTNMFRQASDEVK